MFKKYLTKIKNYMYGSKYILATGFVVVPIVNDISIILAGQLTSLMTTLGWYAAKKGFQMTLIIAGGIIGLLF